MAASIEDVAKLANVSISTVSRVINRRKLVNEETCKRVEAAIRELRYRPNAFARGLMLRKSGVPCRLVNGYLAHEWDPDEYAAYPSDAALDKRFKLARTAETSVYFSTSGMEKGMYRARLRWTMDGEEFFLEQVIHL